MRYADDFLLGFHGPEGEAEAIKGRIGDFLHDHLKLELSPEKTLITPATETARFLGYEITTFAKRDSDSVSPTRANRGGIKLLIPAKVVVNLSGLYKGKGQPRPKMATGSMMISRSSRPTAPCTGDMCSTTNAP